jgi:superfamily II DNA/RNA helicase
VAKRLAAGRVYYQDEESPAGDEVDGLTNSSTNSSSSTPSPSAGGRILVMSLLEGSKNRRQRAWAWAEPPHVVIGNPLALSNMVEHGGFRYHQVKMVVVDEVDACLLNRESRSQLHTLLARYLSPSYYSAELMQQEADAKETMAALPVGVMKERPSSEAEPFAPWKLVPRQTVFCSATIPQHNHFIKQVGRVNGSGGGRGDKSSLLTTCLLGVFGQCLQNKWTLKDPRHIQVHAGELMPSQLRHNYLVCPSEDRKLAGLRSLLKKEAPRLESCIVFTSGDAEAQEVTRALSAAAPSLGLDELPPPDGQPAVRDHFGMYNICASVLV